MPSLRAIFRLPRLSPTEQAYAWIALVLLAGLLNGALGTGNHELWMGDEPRVAGISREMWKTGTWAIPRLSGEPFLEQPPLFYLSQVLVFASFGYADAALARVPPAIFSWLSLAFTLLLGMRFFSPRACVAGGLVLLTTAIFVHRSHWVVVDSALLFGVTGALACFAHAQRPAGAVRTGWMAGASAFLAVGFFSKGLIGFVMPGIAMVTYLLWTRRIRDFLAGLVMAFAAASLLAGLWLCFVWRAEGASGLMTFLLHNQVERFFPGAADYGGGHVQPWYYYVIRASTEFLPWLPLVLLACALARRHWRALAERERSGLQLIASVLVPNLLVLSLAGTKRGLYLLPLAPFVGLLVGWWMDSELARQKWDRTFETGWRWLIVGMVVALPAAPVLLGEARAWPWLLACLLLGALAVRFGTNAASSAGARWCGALGGLTVALGCALISVPPLLDRTRNLQPIARELDEVIPPGASVCAYRPSEILRGLVAFYTDRPLCIVWSVEQLGVLSAREEMWLLVEQQHLPRGVAAIEAAGVPHTLFRDIGEGEGSLQILRFGAPPQGVWR